MADGGGIFREWQWVLLFIEQVGDRGGGGLLTGMNGYYDPYLPSAVRGSGSMVGWTMVIVGACRSVSGSKIWKIRILPAISHVQEVEHYSTHFIDGQQVR